MCTMLFGPVATIATFLFLPSDDGTGGLGDEDGERPVGWNSHMRVLHLSLADSDVKARFVIDERSDWESFLAGCAERLQLVGVERITDASGQDQIHTVSDLVHEDNIIVHASVHPLANRSNVATTIASSSASPSDAVGSLSIHGSPTATVKQVATVATLHAGEAACPARHPHFRVAMLIPLLGTAPPYLPYFLASAARSSPLIDWLVFHEHLKLPWEQKQLPNNVKLVDLGGGGIAELVGLKLGERLELPLRNATTVLRSLRLLFERWPRLIAEYKPTFGSVFEDFLSDYSHWGYADLDMILGNVPLFMEREELEQQDIVTYAFGDAEGLYLRGQWTVHRNRPEVSRIWEQCTHLGSGLEQELSTKVSALREGLPTRFLSAEGCYSYEAVRANLRVKIANKQAVGLQVPSTEQVLFVAGSVWSCPAEVVADDVLIRQLSERTAREPCILTLPPLQRSIGGLSGLRWKPEGCGNWIPSDFRLCVADAPSSLPTDPRTVAVYAVDGSFYAQRLEDAGLEHSNGCRQAAFFHFQEWKKAWAADAEAAALSGGTPRIAPFEAELLRRPPPFRVTTAGISIL
jgi:hypothetical protein